MNKATIAILVGSGIGVAVSCAPTQSVLDPTHCAGNDGDAFCAREHPEGDRGYCWLSTAECDEASGITDLDHDGCLAERPEDACYSACGGGMSVLDDPTCDGVADTTMTSTTGTETMSSDTPATSSSMTADPTTQGMTETSPTESDTTDGPGCSGDDDCMDAGAPFCDPGGVCVACDGMPDGDAACAGADPGLPVCEAGVCVQCTEANAAACEGQTPICGGDSACRACVEHSECPDSACHLDGDEVGACFEAADVVMANTAAGLVAEATGVGAGDDLVIELAGGVDYNQTVNVTADAEIALLGPASAELTGTAGLPSLNVAGNAIVYVAGPTLASGETGVDCSGTAIWLDDSQVRNNAQLGLEASGGCAAHLRRSLVAINDAGGIDIAGGELHMSNSVVGRNGDEFSSTVGGLALDGTGVSITYSTIAINEATTGSRGSIGCTAGESGEIRNSIIAGGGNSIDCATVTFTTNAVDDSSLGGSNDNVGPAMAGWFANVGGNDFRLSVSGQAVLADIAMWVNGDPLADFEGDPIPTAMPSFPGYDQP